MVNCVVRCQNQNIMIEQKMGTLFLLLHAQAPSVIPTLGLKLKKKKTLLNNMLYFMYQNF